ncbi:hypothetical protein CerSpe_168360 [Prunus speciosa]
MLSKKGIILNVLMLSVAVCYWNSASNTFDFGLGPMTPAILDMASLFGFRPHGVSVDVLEDNERKGCEVKTAILATKTEILRKRKYPVFMQSYQNMVDKE